MQSLVVTIRMSDKDLHEDSGAWDKYIFEFDFL